MDAGQLPGVAEDEAACHGRARFAARPWMDCSRMGLDLAAAIRAVGLCPECYVCLVTYGLAAWDGNPPNWARKLIYAPTFQTALAEIADPPLKHGDARAKLHDIARWLLEAYVSVLRCMCAGGDCPDVGRLSFTSVPRGAWSRYLVVSFPRACCLACKSLNCRQRFPLVTCSPQHALDLPVLRKKWNGGACVAMQLSVPAVSRRLGTCQEKGATTPSDAGLLASLRELAPTVPCGNPFNALVRSLAFRGLLSVPRVVLPVGEPADSEISRDLCQKVLAYNVLFPCIALPIWAPAVARRVLEKTASAPRVVICLECGYCLNFGRGKFDTVNFPPTNVFFSRDQKEKQLSVCATTGRIYCSYCGGSYMRVVSLFEITCAGEPYIRCVLANNAAHAIRDANALVSVVVPCLAAPDCASGLLKRLRVSELFYLTSSISALSCGKCDRN
ncbi:ORF66 [macacine gammaherpesvirus 12]|uniref:ORF66 n=1 Tax=macacine gammaherpesvirus 12 TaxID=2560571 RepID=A0A0B5D5I3_9GAMA|nr:ORF66 [Macaca nemestrina rhadinovirus 2]AJE29722.1 ORF66 [Macaca nemestrina rhadinovirus 2]